jgi:hypothetical protein
VNRWTFLAVLAVTAGAVAGFAIYTFGWRGDNSTSQQASAYADAIAAQCDPHACAVERLARIEGDDWKAVLRDPSDGQVFCALIQADRFAERAAGGFAGVSRLNCAEARAGRAPPRLGPEWWKPGEASEKLAHSRWAFSHQLSEAIFDCVGQGTRRDDRRFRRFACTYEYGGASLDRSGRVEVTTTARDRFRVDSFG